MKNLLVKHQIIKDFACLDACVVLGTFLGYAPSHKDYKFMDKAACVCISKHVQVYEDVFPFAKKNM